MCRIYGHCTIHCILIFLRIFILMKYFQKWLKNDLQKPTYQANYTKKGQIGIDWLIASFGFETTVLWRIYDGIEADTVRVRKIGFEFPISELWQAAGSLMSQIWSFRDQTPRLRIVFTSVPTALRPCFLFLFTRAFYSKRVGYRERVDIQIFKTVLLSANTLPVPEFRRQRSHKLTKAEKKKADEAELQQVVARQVQLLKYYENSAQAQPPQYSQCLD